MTCHNKRRVVMAAKYVVTGDQYRTIHRRARELFRQLDQEGGSPLDPDWLACRLQMLVEGKQDFLHKIATAAVSGAKKFVAKDALKEANVGYTGSNFDRFFLNKVEEGVGDATIAIYHLERDSLDAPIMTELGSHAEINLAYLFELLKKQSKGESGPLLINGYANIAYIKGSDGNFWAVDAGWHSGRGYWSVDARSVEFPDRWGAGYQVLSCDS